MFLLKHVINDLIESSIRVFKDCTLRNGAIVASNSKKSYFPTDAKNYRFVWIRDASYICLAAKKLGIDLHTKFFEWCLKAEDWKETGLFYEKYHVIGKKALFNFQPDQTGTLLFAIKEIYDKKKTELDDLYELIKKTANGICESWEKDHFKFVIQDLWEERYCFPDYQENLTYSLAASLPEIAGA